MPSESEIETQIKQKEKSLKNEQPELLQGKYEITQHIGEGGMGKVYRGRDQTLKREVAIKEFSPSQDFYISKETWRELETAFQREATLLANLRHESLPMVFDFFMEDFRQYLVMEFVEGDDLKKQAKELREKYDGQFAVKKVRKWAEDLLEVLTYLHDRESPIFHRDIKPENLKLRGDKICLLDFGLAKGSAGNISSSSITDRTTYGFTARYAPVEQINGEKTTVQTDIYALSATLYYLLTGVEPIDARKRCIDVQARESDPLRDVKTLRPETDDAFIQIITQGLAIEAKDRPRSARQMLNILRAEKTSRPEPAPNPVLPANTTPYPLSKPISLPNPQPAPHDNSRMRKTIIYSIVSILGLSVITFIITLYIWMSSDDSTSEDNSSKTPQTTTVKTEWQLLNEQDLYEFPGRRKVIGKIDKNAKVQIDDHRAEPSGGFSVKVKSDSKEGWIICEKDSWEKCFSSK